MITISNFETARTVAENTGRDMDIRKTLTFETYGEAHDLYKKVCERLLHVNGWNQLNGIKENQYRLFNNLGQPKFGLAEEGDYIRFNLPAPRPDAGKGYDWVRIERIRNLKGVDRLTFGMRVRPASDPTKNESTTAHFYTTKTTNTFTAELHDNHLIVGIHPRNEIINTAEVDDLYSKMRNLLVGFMSWLGIARSQWASLINGLVAEQ